MSYFTCNQGLSYYYFTPINAVLMCPLFSVRCQSQTFLVFSSLYLHGLKYHRSHTRTTDSRKSSTYLSHQCVTAIENPIANSASTIAITIVSTMKNTCTTKPTNSIVSDFSSACAAFRFNSAVLAFIMTAFKSMIRFACYNHQQPQQSQPLRT